MARKKATARRRQSKADLLANGLVRHQVSVLRVSAGLERTATARVARVRDMLIAELLRADPTAPARIGDKRRLAAALAEEAKRIAAEEYSGASDATARRLRELAAEDVRITAREVTRVSGLTVDVLPWAQMREVVSEALIDGSPLSDWWAKQSEKVAFDFAARVRKGIENGDSIQKITAGLRGTREHGWKDGDYATWKRNATTLVQTSVMSTVNSVRFAQMQSNPEVYRGYTWSAIFDPKTCEVCMALSGGLFDLETGAPLPDSPVQATPDVPHPPQHPNCRCIMLPVIEGYPAPEDVGYEQWLDEQPEEVQIEALGPKRWELWNEGKITGLKDLISQDGRAMKVKELQG